MRRRKKERRALKKDKAKYKGSLDKFKGLFIGPVGCF